MHKLENVSERLKQFRKFREIILLDAETNLREIVEENSNKRN